MTQKNFLLCCQLTFFFSIVVNPSFHSLSLLKHLLILSLCKLHRYHIRRYQSSSCHITFSCLFGLQLCIDGILSSQLAYYLCVQYPPIPYFRFRTSDAPSNLSSDSVPPMHILQCTVQYILQCTV